MKQILTLSIVLVVLAVAIIGCMYIFDMSSYENAVSNLMKTVAAIILLGGCSAVIAFLMRSKNEPPS